MSRTHSAKGRVGRVVKYILCAEDAGWREIALGVVFALILVAVGFGLMHLTAVLTMALR